MSTSPFKVRSPGAVVGLSVVTLGIYSAVWYYKINRELRDFGRDHGDHTLGSSRPVRSLLAVTLGGLVWIPTIVSVVGTAERLDAAERLGSVERRSATAALAAFIASVILSGVGPFLSPLLSVLAAGAWLLGMALVQTRLNAVWRRSVAPAR